MLSYLLRRLMLLPLTLFCIILVNFVIVNMAPGDPVTVTEVTQEGATRGQDRSVAFGSDDRYLQFREWYGLTLPILFNTWPWLSEEYVQKTLWRLVHRKWAPNDEEEIPVKKYDDLRMKFGDQSRYIMPDLLRAVTDTSQDIESRRMASRFFVRGGTRQGHLGPDLTLQQKAYNRKVAQDNQSLNTLLIYPFDTAQEVESKVQSMEKWYAKNRDYYHFEPTTREKIKIFFFESRFFRYMSRVLTLDFGTLRNDNTKTVISEVAKRFKYSLTLSIVPMLITFVLCQVFGFIMAFEQNRLPDISLNVFFLILYAIPVFVVAPFLIEKVALNGYFPFTDIPIPLSGFTSTDAVFDAKTSSERLFDIIQHIFLPIIAVMYGTLAASSRLSRTAVLEVMRQDYVRTARAKGAPQSTIWTRYVGRNAAITIVTSLAASLGVLLGGSLIVETIFEIDGFGKFFYDAIINRDYNVIMFSAIASAGLTLIGYLIADIAYTLLDPRVTLE